MPTDSLAGWLESHRRSCDMEVEEIPWRESREWVLEEGRLRHRTGGFFSIVGLSLESNHSIRLQQPLIDQPEIGILGFLVRNQAGRMHVLVQAKPEPGNMGTVQAAPSVQATESNYKRVHRGNETPFVDYFLGGRDAQVRADSLQSEQGTRFLGKYNRNMVVELPVPAVLEEGDAYRWWPVEELCALLGMDFQINTDARSVLVCAPWPILSPGGRPFGRWRNQGGLGEALLRSYEATEQLQVSSDEAVARRLRQMRESLPFAARVISLSYAGEWIAGRAPVLAGPGDSFEVRHFRIKTSKREVGCWDQPLITSGAEGVVVLLAKEINGVLHFLFRCRAEVGFKEGFQYGPSIQSSGGVPAIVAGLDGEEDAFLALHQRAKPLLSSLHSDEGGRFYRCVSRYSIKLLDSAGEVPPATSMSWMSLGQIERFSRRQGFFSNEARSLVSMLLAHL